MKPATKDPKRPVSLRLPRSVREQLSEFSKLTGQPQSVAATEALSDYLAWRIPQLKDLKEAIAAADRGEFADPKEVESFFAKHARPMD